MYLDIACLPVEMKDDRAERLPRQVQVEELRASASLIIIPIFDWAIFT